MPEATVGRRNMSLSNKRSQPHADSIQASPLGNLITQLPMSAHFEGILHFEGH